MLELVLAVMKKKGVLPDKALPGEYETTKDVMLAAVAQKKDKKGMLAAVAERGWAREKLRNLRREPLRAREELQED